VSGIVRHPWGPRVYLLGRRVHHGSAGCVIGALGLAFGDPLLSLAGIGMVAHDIRDFPWRDGDNHAPADGAAAAATVDGGS
jgi:hypothetical protein